MKGKNFALALFIIISLCLAGYVCYDKFFSKACDCNNNCVKNINKDQKVTVRQFVSNYGKTAYHDGRVALTLYSQPNNDGMDYGFFSLDVAYDTEFNGVAEGNYTIKEGKLMLTMFSINEAGLTTSSSTFTKELGVTLSATDMENWYQYNIAYNDSEIKIGNITLYAVNK